MMLRFYKIPSWILLRPRSNYKILHGVSGVKNYTMGSKVFEENVIPEERKRLSLHNSINKFYRHHGQFKNSRVSTFKLSKSDRITTNTPTIAPIDFHKIVVANKHNVPQVGSFVEFEKENLMRVGVVIQNLLARFDERFNHVLVLTDENEILAVKPLHVKFHLYKFVSDGAINYSEILRERYNPSQSDRERAVSFIQTFMMDTIEWKKRTSPLIQRVFSQLVDEKICPVSSLDVIDSMEFKESDVARINSSLYNQHALLYATHGNLVDSCQWVVPNYAGDFSSNVFLWGHSNNFHLESQYFVNAQNVWLRIYHFKQTMSSQDGVEKVNKFMQKLKSLPKEEISAYLNVFEGRHFIDVIMAMKFAVVYPHSSIVMELEKLDCFNSTPTASDIHCLLLDLKVFDDTTTITDIYLSLGLFGTPKNLSVTRVDQLKSPTPSGFDVKDNFAHLRTSRKYYQDHVIYALVDDEEGVSSFGISIESLNSRKHLINIHVPDIITHISPDTKIFKSIFQKRSLAETLTHLCNNKTWGNIYPEKIMRDRRFHEYSNYDNNEEIWGDVIDLMEQGTKGTRKRGISKATCLTITFEFNSYESNPFEDLAKKVSVSFDSISNVNTKIVNRNILQKCLTGRLEPSFFRLLRRKQRNESDVDGLENSLNKTDIHNLNYISGVLKTFQKVRELDGAATSLKDLSLFENSIIRTKFNETTCGISSDIIKPSLSNTTTPQADFLHKEVKIFTGCLVSKFCFQNQIPMISQSQDLDVNEFENDGVMVQHENVMIPVYESRKYSHSVMAKDEDGLISLNAKLISNNYLAPKYATVGSEFHVPLGLSLGYTEVLDVFQSGKAFFNQFQLLSHIQQDYQKTILKRHSYLDFIERFNNLKSLGYLLNGPLPERKLILIINSINSNDLRKTWQYRMYKFWILSWLHQHQFKNGFQEDKKLDCICTHFDRLDEYGICKAYCPDLGIEVDVLYLPEQDVKIGTSLVGHEVLHLDPIGGFCMLDGREDICI